MLVDLFADRIVIFLIIIWRCFPLSKASKASKACSKACSKGSLQPCRHVLWRHDGLENIHLPKPKPRTGVLVLGSDSSMRSPIIQSFK